MLNYFQTTFNVGDHHVYGEVKRIGCWWKGRWSCSVSKHNFSIACKCV